MTVDEIVSIKKIGKRQTIDIEVSGDRLFFCNDILTHNSAAGDVADVTEESVQGGISKIQAADNVLALIPNSQARAVEMLRIKFLKTRDSAGVGHTVDFKTEWATLSFIPKMDENGNKQSSWQGTPRPINPATGTNEKRFEKPSDNEDSDDNSDNDTPKTEFSAAAALRRAGGPNKKRILGKAKSVKLV